VDNHDHYDDLGNHDHYDEWWCSMM
jgi:hypothetical protein